MSTCFLLCVERGPLESQTLLCVESLRRWGGEMADAPVYTFAPRPGSEPAAATVDRLGELGVQHVSEPLNTASPDLPHCNKVYVSAWAERELEHQVLVFTDSDTVFLHDPALLAPAEWPAAARPVGQTNAGSTGEGHRNEPAWQALYDELGVKARPFLESNVEGERIRAYFNAGLLAVRRDTGILGEWRDALDRLLASSFAERHGGGRKQLRNQIDQLAFAGVVADRFEQMLILPATYNYPLPKRILQPPEMQALNLDDLVHVHGHRWLHLPGFLREVHPPLDESSERYRWLDSHLPLEPTIEGPFRFPAPGREPGESA
jgi:hypothetical protein